MRLLLTSFGITQADGDSVAEKSVFYRMPPVSTISAGNAFLPDYEALLLCDSVVMDRRSYDALQDTPHQAYSLVAEALRVLHGEGYVELSDFDSIVTANAGLLKQMLDRDLRALDEWAAPLRESLLLWQHFTRAAAGVASLEPQSPSNKAMLDTEHLEHQIVLSGRLAIFHELCHNALAHSARAACDTGRISRLVHEAVRSSRKRKRKEYRRPLRELLRKYLSYVNANIVISNELRLPFHDWSDYAPFYREKFLRVGKSRGATEPEVRECRKLFSVSFPQFAVRDVSTLVRILNDTRVAELRALVDAVVDGKATFDEAFARRTLVDVFRIEQRRKRCRQIVSYATMPIGFLPWIGTVAQKGAEAIAGRPIEAKLRRKYRWFYLLSDVTGDHGLPADGGDGPQSGRM